MYRLESQVARGKVELLIEAGVVRNVHLPVFSGNAAILLQDHGRIVVKPRGPSLKEREDQDNAKFTCERSEPLSGRSRNRLGEVTDVGLLCLAEIHTIMKFLKYNELRTLCSAFPYILLELCNIGGDVSPARLLNHAHPKNP